MTYGTAGRVGAMFAAAMFAASGAAAEEIVVRAGGDLQAALNRARGGDVILLEPGVTYTGNFRLPVHAGGVITLRSAATDDRLPAEGRRITPEFARHLPKLRSPNTQPVISTDPGAANWRLLFLEFQGNERGANEIIALGDGSVAQRTAAQLPQQLTLDRVYVHGDPRVGQKRGIGLNSGQTTIRNSHISEIKAAGQDSQAIAGWNGSGPYVIENNYLEAAGEVVLLGGADPAIPDLVPTDVVLRGNTLTRPVAWRQPILPAPQGLRGVAGGKGSVPAGTITYRVVARRAVYDDLAHSPAAESVVNVTAAGAVTLTWVAVPDATDYVIYRRGQGQEQYWTTRGTTFVDDGTKAGQPGGPPRATLWQVKNLLELKNARRVRIERNTLSNNWAQAQTGFAVLFTPRNQDGGCRWCVVEDVVFEFNTVQGVGAGINILGADDEKPSQQTRNIVIRHNRFLDVATSWGGSGYFLLLHGRPRDVTVEHNTLISPDGAGIVQVDGPPIVGFRFTNNLATHNRYGVIGSNQGPGLPSIKAFFPDVVFSGNVFADCEAGWYPPGNACASQGEFRAQFMDFAAGDFRLKPQSKWMRGGPDGPPPGASVP